MQRTVTSTNITKDRDCSSSSREPDIAKVEVKTWGKKSGKFWELKQLWCQERSCCQDFCSADNPSALINLQIMWQSFQQGSTSTDGSINRCLCLCKTTKWSGSVLSRLSYEKTKQNKHLTIEEASWSEKAPPPRDKGLLSLFTNLNATSLIIIFFMGLHCHVVPGFVPTSEKKS